MQINDIPYAFLESEKKSKTLDTRETSILEALNSTINTNGQNFLDDFHIQLEDNQVNDEKPGLSKSEFKIFLKRLKQSKAYLKKVYLQQVSCSDNAIFFSNTNYHKNELRIASMESTCLIPYRLSSDQKDSIIDILMDYIKEYSTGNSVVYENFKEYTYVFDVLLPQCMRWMQQSIDDVPLKFNKYKKRQTKSK